MCLLFVGYIFSVRRLHTKKGLQFSFCSLFSILQSRADWLCWEKKNKKKKMGRGKIELKKIEKANSLQVRFTNRRKVLMKKANHLSISATRTSPLSSSSTPARFTISLAAGKSKQKTILFVLGFGKNINFLCSLCPKKTEQIINLRVLYV